MQLYNLTVDSHSFIQKSFILMSITQNLNYNNEYSILKTTNL